MKRAEGAKFRVLPTFRQLLGHGWPVTSRDVADVDDGPPDGSSFLRGGNGGSFQAHRQLAPVSEKIGNYLK